MFVVLRKSGQFETRSAVTDISLTSKVNIEGLTLVLSKFSWGTGEGQYPGTNRWAWQTAMNRDVKRKLRKKDMFDILWTQTPLGDMMTCLKKVTMLVNTRRTTWQENPLELSRFYSETAGGLLTRTSLLPYLTPRTRFSGFFVHFVTFYSRADTYSSHNQRRKCRRLVLVCLLMTILSSNEIYTVLMFSLLEIVVCGSSWEEPLPFDVEYHLMPGKENCHLLFMMFVKLWQQDIHSQLETAKASLVLPCHLRWSWKDLIIVVDSIPSS